VRTRTGTPALGGVAVRMGWAVTLGDATSSWPTPGRETVDGDAINLAFRLSGVAARDGRPAVLVTEDVMAAAPDAARSGDVAEVAVKGRAAPARVAGAA
jgi:class 3 adenylate cyclase